MTFIRMEAMALFKVRFGITRIRRELSVPFLLRLSVNSLFAIAIFVNEEALVAGKKDV